MKVLLDECVPWPMHKFLSDHECATAQQRGWGGIKNGDLLKLAEAEFDIFITSDQNIRYQQNLSGRKIALVVLSNPRWPIVRPWTERIVTAVNSAKPGTYTEVDIPGSLTKHSR